jgi:nucleolin
VFRRFASDEANPSEEKSSVESADSNDHGAIRSAIDSATESASTYAQESAQSLTENAERAKDAVVDGAAAAGAGLGFSQREDRRDSRPSYGNENGGRRSYGDRQPARDRPVYGGDRGFGEREGRREPRPLTPGPVCYVGNLLFDVTAADLEREFGEFGSIKAADIAVDARGLSKG